MLLQIFLFTDAENERFADCENVDIGNNICDDAYLYTGWFTFGINY